MIFDRSTPNISGYFVIREMELVMDSPLTKFEVSSLTCSPNLQIWPLNPTTPPLWVFCHPLDGTCQDLSLHQFLATWYTCAKFKKEVQNLQIWSLNPTTPPLGYFVVCEMEYAKVYLYTIFESSSYIYYKFMKGVPKFTNLALDPTTPLLMVFCYPLDRTCQYLSDDRAPKLKFLSSPEIKIYINQVYC